MAAQNLGYLFLAFAATWAGFFGYLFLVQRQLVDARHRLAELEERRRSPNQSGQVMRSGDENA